jgi:hypothetical protein
VGDDCKLERVPTFETEPSKSETVAGIKRVMPEKTQDALRTGGSILVSVTLLCRNVTWQADKQQQGERMVSRWTQKTANG